MAFRFLRPALRAVILGAVATMPAIAYAGGPVLPPPDPVVAPPPAPPVPARATSPFAGPYVGGSIGYAFNGNDQVGESLNDVYIADFGTLGNEGFFGGVHAGYRHVYNRFVFGAEVGADLSDIGSSVTVDGVQSTMSFDHLLTAKGQLGYLAAPNLMVYGTAGVAHADINYSIIGMGSGLTSNDSRTGYLVGGGVEYLMTEDWSVRGEYTYTNFGKYHPSDEAGYSTAATPDFHAVRLGVNFNF